MLKGHIEHVSRTAVRGWIFAPDHPVRDASILAFCGRDCVGAAQVALFRQDLYDAGLGDGFLGFEIPIAGDRVDDLASVVVKLDGSDALLVQPEAHLVGTAGAAERMSVAEMRQALASCRWMLAQGWIEQTEYDFLKALAAQGVYEYALPRQQRSISATQEAFMEIARRRLGVLMQREVTLATSLVDTLDSLNAALHAAVQAAGSERPVVALAGGAFRLRLAEGGHVAGSVVEDAAMVDHRVEAHQMLFLDARMPLAEIELKGVDHLSMHAVVGAAEGH